MGTDTVEFGERELRIVGGDYGTLQVEGTTPEARRALDAILAANRCGSDCTRVLGLIVDVDDATPVLANRHAGLEGTPAGGVQLDIEDQPRVDVEESATVSAPDRPGEGA